LGDRRDLMPLMYYSIDADSTYQAYHMANDEYIRATPSGQLLSGAVFASCLAILLVNIPKKIRLLLFFVTIVMAFGLVANITRSTLIGVLVVCPFLAVCNIPSTTTVKIKRIALLCFGVILAANLALVFMPQLRDRYLDRFKDDYIGSSSFNPRISDNTNALEEIIERPIIGNGLPSLRNYITDTGGDVNSYVMIAVHGGIPLLLLFLCFMLKVWRYRIYHSDTFKFQSLVGFYYILILWTVVAPGANGPHTLRELAPFLLFSSILSRKETAN
jgi:O-antigen ligase